nr:hypothetical protein GCM10017745_59330 [Saccharothrix mutabilis subsp. capreolus]
MCHVITVSRHIAVFSLMCATVTGPGVPPVRVHSLSTAGHAGFVDLHNPSPAAVDLAGWSVESCSGPARDLLVELPAGTVLPPRGHLRIAGLDRAHDGLPRVTVAEVAGDGVALLDQRGALVDRVATAPGSPCRERDAARSCAGTATTPSRDDNSTDTDDNRADFTCAPHPEDPGGAARSG